MVYLRPLLLILDFIVKSINWSINYRQSFIIPMQTLFLPQSQTMPLSQVSAFQSTFYFIGLVWKGRRQTSKPHRQTKPITLLPLQRQKNHRQNFHLQGKRYYQPKLESWVSCCPCQIECRDWIPKLFMRLFTGVMSPYSAGRMCF